MGKLSKYTEFFNLFIDGNEYRFIPVSYLVCINDLIFEEQKKNIITKICSQLNDCHPDRDKRKKA